MQKDPYSNVYAEYRPEDLTVVIDIADAAWKHIFEVRRELLGEKISDVIFPNGEV